MPDTKKPRARKPQRIRPDGMPLYTVSVEMPGPLYESLVAEAEKKYRSLAAHIVAILTDDSNR